MCVRIFLSCQEILLILHVPLLRSRIHPDWSNTRALIRPLTTAGKGFNVAHIKVHLGTVPFSTLFSQLLSESFRPTAVFGTFFLGTEINSLVDIIKLATFGSFSDLVMPKDILVKYAIWI